MMDVCSNIPDVGLEVSRAASRASSTLEGGLRSQEVGQGRSIPMEVTENPSALEVVVAKNPVLKGGASGCPAPEGVVGNDPARVGSASCNPAPEGVAGDDPAPMGSAGCNPAPEGVRAGSPSHTSMDVHIGSSPPHSDGIVTAHASNEEVALEIDAPNARVLMPASGVELISGDVLRLPPLIFLRRAITWLLVIWDFLRSSPIFR
jgi:hypothetical protein